MKKIELPSGWKFTGKTRPVRVGDYYWSAECGVVAGPVLTPGGIPQKIVVSHDRELTPIEWPCKFKNGFQCDVTVKARSRKERDWCVTYVRTAMAFYWRSQEAMKMAMGKWSKKN